MAPENRTDESSAGTPLPAGQPGGEPAPASSESRAGWLGASDPHQLTPRERRRRWLLLTLLLLLLALLAYVAFYFTENRRLPTIGVAPPKSDYMQPPQYLYSIFGKGAAEFLRPVGLGVASDGRVYVVDFVNKRVSAFTNSGSYLLSFNKTADGPLFDPVHLAVKGSEVWVSDRRLRGIYIFDLQGKYLRKFTPLHEKLVWTPLAFAFDSDGSLRVTDVAETNRHKLLYFSSDGSRTVTIGSGEEVKALQDAPGSFMFPDGVAVAGNGDVYVSDGDNRRVQVFDRSGHFVRFLDTSGVPRGIAIDAKQRVYVADALAHTIGVFDPQGKSLTSFGSRGFGPGQFNYPNDVAVDNSGHIFISDRENNQVQVWGWPVAQVPPLALPRAPLSWLTALLCLLPLLLIPPLLLSRRKVSIVVTPDFVERLEQFGEIGPVSQKPRIRLIAPEEDRLIYENRVVDGVKLDELITFEVYSESDARVLRERLECGEREALLLAMASRAKALATDTRELRLLARVSEIRAVDIREFREIYLHRDISSAGPADS